MARISGDLVAETHFLMMVHSRSSVCRAETSAEFSFCKTRRRSISPVFSLIHASPRYATAGYFKIENPA